jgi:hypothetical protein
VLKLIRLETASADSQVFGRRLAVVRFGLSASSFPTQQSSSLYLHSSKLAEEMNI